MRFVDTNVLLYAISKTRSEQAKSRIALRLLDEEDLALSVQVLQEFYVQATRTGKKHALSHEQATALIESWLRFPVQENSMELMWAALHSCKNFLISYWDAMIIEAARKLDCSVVLTEDLADGRDYQGVRVVNPFR